MEKRRLRVLILFILVSVLLFSNLVLAFDAKELALRLNRIELMNGDVNADGKVDIFDLASIGLYYGTREGDVNWNWKADIANSVGEIDIFDLAEVGLNYGKDYEQVIDDPVFISPESKDVLINNSFSVEVNISTLSQVYAVDFTLVFDPNVIEVVGVVEGNFLKKDGASTYPIINIKKTEGKIDFANTRFGTISGVTGDGTLAKIDFKAVKAGKSGIEFVKFIAVDPSLNEIFISSINGTVNVLGEVVNTPPDLTGIPDKNTNEDTQPAANWVDLYAYASDKEDTDDKLIFSIQSQSNSALINCNIAGNRYLNCDKPTLNQFGYNDVTVKVTDTGGLSATDTTRITVNSINDLPVANDDVAVTLEDTPIEIDVLANDNDVEGAVTLDAITVQPAHGTAIIYTGEIKYTPAQNYNGKDSLEYRIKDLDNAVDTAKVNITVKSVNNLPVANANGPYTANEGSIVKLNGSKSYDVDGAITSYLWDLDNDGQFDDATGSVIEKTWNNEYSGQICLKVIGDLGTEADSDTDCTTIEIKNIPPTAPVVKINPSQPKTNDNLICKIIEESVDVDEITYEYAWYKNGVLVGGEITNTLSASLTKKGERWKCRVIPTDGTEFGPSAENEVLIQNSAPSITSFSPLTNPSIQEKQSQGFSVEASDIDEDVLTIKWYLDGQEVASGNNYNYVSDYASQGIHEVKVVVSDGEDTAEKIWQLTVLDTYTRIFLKAGNNIFSLPRNQEKSFNELDTNCEVVFEGERADLAFYKPSKENISIENYIFIDLDEILRPGQGYFVKVQEDCYIEISGDEVTLSDLGYLGSQQLLEGWNLVGAPTSIQAFSAGTCQLFGGVGILKYAYNVNSCQQVEGYNGGYSYCTIEGGISRCRCQVNNFEPGFGYWIRTANDCALA